MSKVMGDFFSNFGSFYHAHSPNVVMPPKSETSKFFYFVHKISGGKALYFRRYKFKTSREGGGDTPPSIVLLRLIIILR